MPASLMCRRLPRADSTAVSYLFVSFVSVGSSAASQPNRSESTQMTLNRASTSLELTHARARGRFTRTPASDVTSLDLT